MRRAPSFSSSHLIARLFSPGSVRTPITLISVSTSYVFQFVPSSHECLNPSPYHSPYDSSKAFSLYSLCEAIDSRCSHNGSLIGKRRLIVTLKHPTPRSTAVAREKRSGTGFEIRSHVALSPDETNSSASRKNTTRRHLKRTGGLIIN